MGQVKGILKEEKMIYESLKEKKEYPRKEDYTSPGCGLDGYAYDAAVRDYEVHMHSGYGVWKDEETGEILFTEKSDFIPDGYYHDSGQGEWKTEYLAHFPLKPGQTAEEAFKERYNLDEEKKALFQDAEKRAQMIQGLSSEIQSRLQKRVEFLKHQSDIQLNQKYNQAVQLALKQEERRRQLEKRNQDPLWQATRLAAKALFEKKQGIQARLLIRNYLKSHEKN